MQENAKGPCIDCKSRKSACHDSCVRYNAWLLTWEGVKEKEREAKEFDQLVRFGNQREKHKRQC